MAFRWLHISDIHFSEDADNDSFRDNFLHGVRSGPDCIENYGLEWQIKQTPVDCILLTGDLFNRGKWSSSQRGRALAFLKEIYHICSDASIGLSAWNWTDGQPMDRLYYCPGNHDLNRNAVNVKDDIVSVRSDVLPAIVKQTKTHGYFIGEKDPEYSLMTQATFGPFFHIMGELTGHQASNLEVQLFMPPQQVDPDGVSSVAFVSINTALTAGQLYDGASLEPDMLQLHQLFRDADRVLNTQEALTHYKKFHELAQKRLGKIANDRGNLCFISESAQQLILDELAKQKSRPIVVLLGHHPITDLSEQARSRFQTFAKKCNASRIYICGHNHIPEGDIFSTIDKYGGSPLYQVCVGGIFADNSGYNQCSFSIGTLQPSPSSDRELSYHIDLYRYYKDVFHDWKWTCFSKDWPVPKPPLDMPSCPPPLSSTKEAAPEAPANPKIEEDDKYLQNKELGTSDFFAPRPPECMPNPSPISHPDTETTPLGPINPKIDEDDKYLHKKTVDSAISADAALKRLATMRAMGQKTIAEKEENTDESKDR